MNSFNSFEKIVNQPKKTPYNINPNKNSDIIFNDNKSEIQKNSDINKLAYNFNQRKYQTEINYPDNDFKNYCYKFTKDNNLISKNLFTNFSSNKSDLNHHILNKKPMVSVHSKKYLQGMQSERNVNSMYKKQEIPSVTNFMLNNDKSDHDHLQFEKDLISVNSSSIKNENFLNNLQSQKRILTLFNSKNTSVKDISNLFNEEKKNTFPFIENQKSSFTKIFDPTIFDKFYKDDKSKQDLEKKFNFFLKLPQILNFDNLNNCKLLQDIKIDKPIFLDEEKHSTEDSKINEKANKRILQKDKMETLIKEQKQISQLSEDQKYKKISKKLRRAWNLNQQIPVNVFKKQIIIINIDNEEDLSEFSEDAQLSQNKTYFDFYEKSSFKNNTNRERKSKMEAKNNIQKRINERKKRVSSCNGKEQLKYKRLVGLKREVDKSLFPKNQTNNKNLSNLLSPTVNQQFLSSFVKNGKSKKNKKFDEYFEYIEFLDFSCKNINKPIFFGNSLES